MNIEWLLKQMERLRDELDARGVPGWMQDRIIRRFAFEWVRQQSEKYWKGTEEDHFETGIAPQYRERFSGADRAYIPPEVFKFRMPAVIPNPLLLGDQMILPRVNPFEEDKLKRS